MLPLLLRSVGPLLKVQCSTGVWPISCWNGSQVQNKSQPSKTPLIGSSFGLLTLDNPETSLQKQHLRDIDHMVAVIDNKTVITGSFNWSPSAAHANDETLLIIDSPQLAQHCTREMDRLWRGAEFAVTARMQRTLQRRREQCGSGAERG